ncbi:MAG: phosphoglucosamine mutase [Firmicutes bacterium]|nr:phosphoglucosamine mutase [Bacillota bacterium]
MGRLFGTDGVRGIANRELTPELAFSLGKALCHELKKTDPAPTVVLGKDTRLSCDLLEQAVSAGIMVYGGTVIKVGVLPTPAVALITREYGAGAGIVISASHNSFEYNGIKVFNSEGMKLSDSMEEEIEDLIISNVDPSDRLTGTGIGRTYDASDDARRIYEDHLMRTVDFKLLGKKIVLDCANGACFKVAPEVFMRLGADVYTIGNTPDGTNINDRCGSTVPEALARAVREIGAQAGFAFDGDGDRLITVDEEGRILDGDRAVGICAMDLKASGRLDNMVVTTSVMSNSGLWKTLEGEGIRVEITGVGDRYVLDKMLETGCVLGGEQTGHMIFSEYSTAGDGILSALQIMRAVRNSGMSLAELYDKITIYPQVLLNARIQNEFKKTYLKDPDIQRILQETEETLKDRGRLVIRTSGTEAVIRILIEGDSEQEIRSLAEAIASMIEEKYGGDPS